MGHSGGMGGPLDPKVVGWFWGWLWGAGMGIAAGLFIGYLLWH
jgi:hypothetical protein